MNRMKLWGVAATAALATTMIVAAPAPADPDDGSLGGTPLTTAGSSLCPEDVNATGVSGTIGDVGGNPIAGTVTMQCVNDAPAVGSMGTGTAGAAASSACAAGQLAVGIEGREGDFIDTLAVRCQDKTLIGAVTTATGYGGPGGAPDGPIDCPPGQAMGGLTGTVTDDGVYVRNVLLSCFVPLQQGNGVLGGPSLPTAGSSTCPAGVLATGVSGTLGLIGMNPIAGTVKMKCEGGAASTGTMGTGNTSGAGSSTCPAGRVAVGIQGREGDFIDNLAVRCRAKNLTGPVTVATGYGGSGGGADGPYDCPAGQALTGLNGTVTDDGVYVRNVVISCATVPPPVDTTTSLKVKKKAHKLKVSGKVAPNQAGTKVKVTLLVRQNQDPLYEAIAIKRPKLNGASKYKTSFSRPDSGSCKIVVKFPGDDDSNPSSKTKKFSC